jgi:hypothetical protein
MYVLMGIHVYRRMPDIPDEPPELGTRLYPYMFDMNLSGSTCFLEPGLAQKPWAIRPGGDEE